MTNIDFKDQMKRDVVWIENKLQGFLPKEEGYQKTIFSSVNYSLLAGGKRIRPMIMLETYRAVSKAEVSDDLIRMMSAIEMIHTSSLVHDDLPCMDNDMYRRGRYTTWYQFGEATGRPFGEAIGVLAGDALLTYAFEVAAGGFAMTKHPERLGEAIRILANKTGIYGMIGGQTLDVELTDQAMDEGQLDFIFRLKTGALLEASMMIGAVLAGADKELIEVVERIAAKVGKAFQIRDDILDVISTTEELGKPVHSDEKNNKTTYVTLYGMAKAEQDVEILSREAIDLLKVLPGDTSFLEALFYEMITRKK